MSPTLLLLLAGCAGAAFPDRAKIRTEGGALVLQAAYDKDIELRPSGPRSRVLLNGRDLAALLSAAPGAPAAPSAPNAPNAPAALSAPLQARLDALERALADNVTAVGLNLTAVWARLRRVSRGLAAARAAAARRGGMAADHCASRPCLHGGTCLSLYAGFHCLCPDNWEGADCGDDVDECRRFAGTELGCQNDGLCVNRPGGYSCQCRRGWLGVHCARATSECTGAGGDAELCGHGVCVPAGARVRCLCDRGWTQNATDAPCLTDIDECSNGEARCSSNPKVECINTQGGFRCGACPAGYEGDGFSCADVDECARDNGGCSLTPRVACLNTPGSRACGPCPPGYAGDGALCGWRGSCAEDNGGCHPAAECRAGAGGAGPQCVCPAGARGDGIGVAGCVLTPNATHATCESGPCGAHGRCLQLQGGYTCLCERGYGGARCELAPDACATTPCGNGGTCIADPRASLGFRCVCSAQFSGERCQRGRALCGGVLRAPEGSIEFPEGNGTYAHGARCAWVIQTRPDQVLNVTFSRFDVERSPECSYDFLQMHDGRSSAAQFLGRFCGSALPRGGNVVSSHDALYLWFLSDRTVARRGFALSWRSVAPACGGELAAGHGRVASPGSPGRYPPGRDCYWLITAPPGRRVALHFFQMDLESHSNCSFDFLAVYDGARETDPLLRRYCSSELPAPLTSASSVVLLHFHSDASGAGLGFQLAYSAEPGVPGCGGVYTAPRGDLSSPSAGGAYLDNLLCDYVIRAPPDSRIKVTFSSFVLENSLSCEFDNLKIYDGESEDASLAGSYCGTARPPAFTSSGNALLLRFRTDHNVNSEGFKVTYETVCQHILRGPTGVITSPGFPMNYTSNKMCEYIIEASPGQAVRLDFQVFDLENNRYFNCVYDFVEVRDGGDRDAALLGRWCGQQPPPSQLSTLNLMYIRFRSDASLSGVGFYANYTTVDTHCGGVHRRAPGVVTAPLAGTRALNCTWIIAAPPGFYVHLRWDYFFVDDRSRRGWGTCDDNYVQLIEDQAGDEVHIPRFCGRTRPPELSSIYNRLKILMVTNDDSYGIGFSLNYTFVDGSTSCGGQYAHARGTVRSPGWPGPYPASRDCVWRVTAPAGQQVRLRSLSFGLSPAYSSCLLVDYLEVRDGPSADSPLLGSYCGTKIPTQIVSMSNALYLHFHSDAYRSGKGFELEWDSAATGCGGTLTGASGSIASPGFPQAYGDNAECQYRIVTSPGTRIKLSFAHLQLEASRDCRSDYVEVHDGPDAGARSLGRFCTMNLQATELATESNVAYVVFRSDISVTGVGFNLQYFTICQNNITGTFGVIESPGFPDPYPRGMDCKWNITVAPGNTINLVFSHFVVRERVFFLAHGPQDTNCRFDYVKITDPDARTSHSYCGYDRPPAINSRGRSLLIEFVSKTAPWATGFHLEWTKKGCGGTIQKSFGTLQLGGELASRSPLECEWLIETPDGTSVSLTVSQVHLAASAGCAGDALAVYGGGSVQAPLLTRLCHDGVVHAMSSTNRMLVRLTKNSDLRDARFAAVFQKSALECGGLIMSPSGLIHSKNYPQNYDNGLDCTWTIHVAEHHRIALRILDLDLYATDNPATACGDYLQLSDTALWAENASATTKVCADSNVTDYVSKGNVMGVRFVSDAAGTAKGFKANFSITCGAVITARFDGTITNDDSMVMSNDNCTWTIIASKPEDKISLTLTHLSLPRDSDGTSSAHCPSTFLRVYDGTDAAAPLVGEYCGRAVPPTIVSRGSALTVQYGSHRATSFGKFSATYSALAVACGGALSAERGRIASPGFPAGYPAGAACEWTLATAPGNRVRVSFESFDLEASDNCDADYVELRESDGAGRLLGLYCGGRAPSDVITVADRVYVKFRSDGERSAPGFVLEYEMVHGLDVTGRERGEIASPLYPHLLDGPADYSWRIYLNDSANVVLQIDYLKIYDHGTECNNYLAIYDGYDEEANRLDLLCGIRSSMQLTSTSNVMYLKLKLDETNKGSKFHLKWWKSDLIVDADSDEIKVNCGGNHTETVPPGGSRVLTSPGFPARYDNNLRCEWQLRAAPAHQLTVVFNTILLEERFECYADSISIYSADNDLVWKPLNKSICTSEVENVVFRSPAYLKIKFLTDHSITYQGFKATVRSECGGQLTNSSGILELSWQDWEPHKYQGLVCEWTIRVRPGRTIGAVLQQFNISNPQDHCESYLILRNGDSSESPLLASGKYCGAPHELKDIATSSNVLYVKYKNPTMSYLTFRLQYEERSVECGATSALSEERPWAAVASPNYPSVPAPYSECEWALSAPRGRALQIDFIDRFDLEDDFDCSKEYVEIHDGMTALAPSLGRYCREKPGTIKSTGNGILVKYATLSLEPRNGFKANVSLSACGGTVRAAAGALAGPGYPRLPLLPPGAVCQWRLVGETDRVLKLKLQDLDLPRSAEPCAFRLTVQETLQPNDTVNILNTCSPDNHTAGTEIVSSTNELTVTLFFGALRDSVVQRRQFRGFRLTFMSSRAAECGGRVAAAEGALLTPGYPRGAGARYCQWFLTAPASRRVALRVIDTPDESLAPSTFRVYNDFNYQTPIQEVNISKIIESTGNKMMVVLWAPSKSAQFKFKAVFTSAQPVLCGGALRGARGSLSAPDLTRAYACAWQLRTASAEPAADDADAGQTLQVTVSAHSSSKRKQCRLSGPSLVLRAADAGTGFSRDVCNSDEVFTVPASGLDISAYKTQTDSFQWTLSWQLNPCGGRKQVTSEPQNILDLPANSTGTLDCAWLLVTPFRERTELKLEGSFQQDCSKEFVTVMNGMSPYSTVVKKFCKDETETTTVSTLLSSMYVQYHTAGGAVSGGAARARLMVRSAGSACGGVLGALERSFSSPGFPRQYPADAQCTWEVRAGHGVRVALLFVQRFVLEQSANCSHDAVVVYDWSEAGGWRELARLCGRDLPPGYNSSDSRMKIVLRTDGAVNLDGFKAQWSPIYGGKYVATDKEQFIYSPRYPHAYPANSDVEYKIDVKSEPTSSQRLVIKFYDFGLEGSAPSCAFDNVTVTPHSEYGLADESDAYCGKELPPARTYQDGATVRLRADAYVQGRGFKLSYKLSRCGRELTAPAVLKFRPDSSRELRCTWRARAPPGQRVVFKFLRVDLPDYESCDMAHVSVYDGESRDAASLARLCGQRGPSAVRTTNESALLEFEADSFDREDYAGFEVAVYFSPGPAAGCGGTVQLTSARPTVSIHSPLPPGAALYAPYLECVWTVEAPPGAAVRVEFTRFHVAPCRGVNQTALGPGRCRCDFVELRDGPDGSGDSMGVFCGHSLPPPAASSGRAMSVLLSTDGEVGSSGFEASLSLQPSACGAAELDVSDAARQLRSPGWPGAAPRGLRCVYRMDAGPEGVLITVDDMRLLPAAADTQLCERDQLVVEYDSDSELEEFGSGVPSEPRREAWCGRREGLRLYAFGRVNLMLTTAAAVEAGATGAGTADVPRLQLSYARPGYCPANTTAAWGRVRTGRFYNMPADCYVLLTAPANSTVTAYFRPLRAYGAQYLQAWDGDSARAPALLDRGEDPARLVALAASGRHLLLHARGLAVDLHYVSTGAGRGCGGALEAAAARVASPLYPAPYRRAGACSWRLQTPPGSTLRLRFAVFDLGALCEQNYVVLRRRDGAEVARYCAEAPATFDSADNFVELVQHSSMNNAGAGWVADFEAVRDPPPAGDYGFAAIDHVDSYQ